MGDTELELVHRHERSDVAPRWPVLIGAGMLSLLPLAVALVALLMNTLWAEPPARPEMFANASHIVDAPRLLVDPQSRLAALRRERHKRLTGYGWVDRARGIVHIPIDVAMQRLAQQGASPAPAQGHGAGASSANGTTRADR